MSTPFRFDPVELPPECEALRREVRAFIADELAAARWTPNSDFGSHRAADFSRRLGERGWIGMTWPRRYGGGERSVLERYIVTEELLAAGAPVGATGSRTGKAGRCCCATAPRSSASDFCPASAAAKCFFCDRHERAGFRLRPRVGPHPREAGRRRLRGDRHEGVDHARAPGAL